jgi:hypothetical protein
MERLIAEPVADLRRHLVGCAPGHAFGIGHDGAVYVVARRGDEPARDGKGRWKTMLAADTEYTVVRAAGDEISTVVIRGERLHVRYVQPCPEGILLVGARCAWRAAGADQNALIVDARGAPVARFTLGDGISDVRVAADGTIWVAYFDEGVFGNFGWLSPGPEPIGASGLVAFDGRGRVRLAYDADAAGTDTICDAYAFNLADDGAAWVYFYTPFALVRLHHGRYRAWPIGVSGAHAIAVRAGEALVLGSYDAAGGARKLALPERGPVRVIGEVAITDPDGRAFGKGDASGAGPLLYFLRDGVVFALAHW